MLTLVWAAGSMLEAMPITLVPRTATRRETSAGAEFWQHSGEVWEAVKGTLRTPLLPRHTLRTRQQALPTILCLLEFNDGIT